MSLLFVLVMSVAIIALLVGDHWRARPLMELNRRIATEPGYLTAARRRSITHLLSTVGYAGPITFVQARKLRATVNK